MCADSNRQELVQAGAVPVFVQLLDSRDVDVQFYCAAALSNLAVSGEWVCVVCGVCVCVCVCSGVGTVVTVASLRFSVLQATKAGRRPGNEIFRTPCNDESAGFYCPQAYNLINHKQKNKRRNYLCFPTLQCTRTKAYSWLLDTITARDWWMPIWVNF